MQEWHRDGFTVSTDQSKLDVDAVHAFLSASYWAKGIPRDVVERSLRHALCFGLYRNGAQIGLARIITDYATIAYLGDVYVLAEYRGRGLATWLMECILAHPDLQGLRRWILITRDAHELYRRYGFTALKRPDGFMELHDPDVYGA